MTTRGIVEGYCREKLAAWPWIKEKVREIAEQAIARDFYLSFSMIHRKVKDVYPPEDPSFQDKMNRVYPGFQCSRWTSRDWARTCLVLALPDDRRYEILEKLFGTADMGEQVTLYRMLYLLPDAAQYAGRASEGIRTNITRVFDAIALDNPYPSRYFELPAWNQMVLKAIFMERPLYRIQGIDQRSNPDLSTIAIDFAHERWAAGREVTPELWRLTQKHITEHSIKDLEKVLSGTPLEKEAALLALQTNNSSIAHDLMDKYALAVSHMSWEEIGKSIQS